MFVCVYFTSFYVTNLTFSTDVSASTKRNFIPKMVFSDIPVYYSIYYIVSGRSKGQYEPGKSGE